jgi:hypothetical protein
MAATALFRGTVNRREGTLCRSFNRTVGLPLGANEGLGGMDGASASWLDKPWGSSPPSPVEASVECPDPERSQLTFQVLAQGRVVKYNGFHECEPRAKPTTFSVLVTLPPCRRRCRNAWTVQRSPCRSWAERHNHRRQMAQPASGRRL